MFLFKLFTVLFSLNVFDKDIPALYIYSHNDMYLNIVVYNFQNQLHFVIPICVSGLQLQRLEDQKVLNRAINNTARLENSLYPKSTTSIQNNGYGRY